MSHPALEASGLFSTYDGPKGQGPVEFFATLKTGEFVYFKARETKVELEVCPTRDDWGDDEKRLAHYREKVPYDAGLMSANDCATRIVRFLRDYVGK